MPERLVVPTDDLFAWTLTGRESLLTHPDDDPRTALSRDRYAAHHLLAQGRHVMAFGGSVLGNLLGALAVAGTTLPDELPLEAAHLHALVEGRWDETADHRRSLAGGGIPDDECDRRAVLSLVDAVPPPTLLHLLRWAGADWPTRRAGWPTHLSWPAGPAGTATRFGDQPYLVRVVTATTALSSAQRGIVRGCQEAGLEVVLLRVNSFGDLPCPDDEALGVRIAPTPGCPECRPAVDVDPPLHLLAGEWPLPPFLSPGVPEERHDHHLRAHRDSTTPTYTVSDDVGELPTEALQLEAFALLTHPEAWKTSRDGGRRHLEPALRRHRELQGNPHLAHEAAERTEAFRAALTSWRELDGPTPSPERRAALREAATCGGRFLALQGFDVVAIRAATGAVNRILDTAPAGGQDPLRLFRLLSLGFTGEELLQMDGEGTYPDEQTIEFLGVLRG